MSLSTSLEGVSYASSSASSSSDVSSSSSSDTEAEEEDNDDTICLPDPPMSTPTRSLAIPSLDDQPGVHRTPIMKLPTSMSSKALQAWRSTTLPRQRSMSQRTDTRPSGNGNFGLGSISRRLPTLSDVSTRDSLQVLRQHVQGSSVPVASDSLADTLRQLHEKLEDECKKDEQQRAKVQRETEFVLSVKNAQIARQLAGLKTYLRKEKSWVSEKQGKELRTAFLHGQRHRAQAHVHRMQRHVSALRDHVCQDHSDAALDEDELRSQVEALHQQLTQLEQLLSRRLERSTSTRKQAKPEPLLHQVMHRRSVLDSPPRLDRSVSPPRSHGSALRSRGKHGGAGRFKVLPSQRVVSPPPSPPGKVTFRRLTRSALNLRPPSGGLRVRPRVGPLSASTTLSSRRASADSHLLPTLVSRPVVRRRTSQPHVMYVLQHQRPQPKARSCKLSPLLSQRSVDQDSSSDDEVEEEEEEDAYSESDDTDSDNDDDDADTCSDLSSDVVSSPSISECSSSSEEVDSLPFSLETARAHEVASPRQRQPPPGTVVYPPPQPQAPQQKLPPPSHLVEWSGPWCVTDVVEALRRRANPSSRSHQALLSLDDACNGDEPMPISGACDSTVVCASRRHSIDASCYSVGALTATWNTRARAGDGDTWDVLSVSSLSSSLELSLDSEWPPPTGTPPGQALEDAKVLTTSSGSKTIITTTTTTTTTIASRRIDPEDQDQATDDTAATFRRSPRRRRRRSLQVMSHHRRRPPHKRGRTPTFGANGAFRRLPSFEGNPVAIPLCRSTTPVAKQRTCDGMPPSVVAFAARLAAETAMGSIPDKRARGSSPPSRKKPW